MTATTKAAHTPGPFEASHYSDIPNEPNWRVFSKTTEGNVGLFYSFEDADAFANAANDREALLEIVQEIARRDPIFAKGRGAREQIARARAAIAKATGAA